MVHVCMHACTWQLSKCATNCRCPDAAARVIGLVVGAGAVQRMLMDQLLFAPFFLSTFLTSLLTLEVLSTPTAPSGELLSCSNLSHKPSSTGWACYPG